MISSSLALAVAAAAVAPALAQTLEKIPANFKTGLCVSKSMPFNPSRVYNLAGNEANRFGVDRDQYDFTIDYGKVVYSNHGANLSLTKSPKQGETASGTRLSSTLYMKYGRITARFTPMTARGVVTTFITWSDVGNVVEGDLLHDEIDWEILGARPDLPETNVFIAKSKHLERSVHGGEIDRKITPGVPHNFTIDWRSDMIMWMVDNVPVRTLFKNQSKAAKPDSLPPGVAWFPTEASRFQVSVWDASTTSPDWAGTPLDWGSNSVLTTPFEFVEVQCYDDNNNPVDRWSTDGSGAPPANTTGNPTGVAPPPPPPPPSSSMGPPKLSSTSTTNQNTSIYDLNIPNNSDKRNSSGSMQMTTSFASYGVMVLTAVLSMI